MKIPSKNYTKIVMNEMLIDKLSEGNLLEMRMAPDQSGYPLTRRQVEKMLSQYERREDEENWNDDPEYRSKEGWLRAKWFPSELTSDFDVQDQDMSGNQRPAKLMPYDYYYTNSKINNDQFDSPYDVVNDDDDQEDSNQPKDWSGEMNPWQ